MEDTNENTNCVKNTASPQDEVFHSSSVAAGTGGTGNQQPSAAEQDTSPTHGAGGAHKRRTTSNNGCARMMSSSSEDDDFCDCDACLLGFDDQHPGEVLEEPRRRTNPVGRRNATLQRVQRTFIHVLSLSEPQHPFVGEWQRTRLRSVGHFSLDS